MKSQESKLLERITFIPGLMGGKPTIRGNRFTVIDIMELLSSGMTHEQILEEHPILEADDIKAALVFSTKQLRDEYIYEWLGVLVRWKYLSDYRQMANGRNKYQMYFVSFSKIEQNLRYRSLQSGPKQSKGCYRIKRLWLSWNCCMEGTPPKLIFLWFGNCSNKQFYDKLKSEIYHAMEELIYGDLDIFEIK